MSETPDSPPPLPSHCPDPPRNRFSEFVAWTVTLVSVAFLAWTASNPIEDADTAEAEIPEGMVSIDEANELAMLKMQSRMLIGMSQIQPTSVIGSFSQLEDMATTARGKAAVAMVRNFIDTKNGKEKSLEYLQEIDTSDPKNQELFTQVKTALENGVTESERTSLEKQMGWFSGLAANSDSESSDEARDEIMADSIKSMTKMFGFGSLFLLGFLAGLALLVTFFIMVTSGKLKLKYDATDSPALSHIFLEAFAIYIGIMALGHLLGTYVDERLSMVAYVVSFLLALLWPTIRGCSWKQSRELIGWNRGSGFLREVGAGFIGWLGIIVIAVGGLILTLIFIAIANLVQGGAGPGSAAGTSHPIVGMLDATEGIAGKLYLLFFAAGIAPFLEETMFRGSLFRYLRRNMGFVISAVLGGIIFAIIHPQGIFALPALSAMGIGFALLREWRDSLIASMTAHALNNGCIVGFLLLVMG